MKELTFIRNNIEKWRLAENIVEDAANQSPDSLADVYSDITADLAFSQTHYPESRITIYLNNLSSVLHNEIYRNRHEKWSRIYTFWTREVPLEMYDARKLLLVAFIITFVSILIGAISQSVNISFARLALGDQYVDNTLENISNGNPLGIYASTPETKMFMDITINNITVAFHTFALGLLTSLGSGWSLFRNGMTLGCFEMMFYQHGLLREASLAIFLHGTLEVSAIIVAGAAGMALGNGWLFPGTYSRLVSFQRGAIRGLKIVVGTVPIFVVAGFIESVVTRHTEIPNFVKLILILGSFLFVIYYFVILPRLLFKKYGHKKN